MGWLLGIGIPVLVIGTIVVGILLSGRGAKKRVEALMAYATGHGDKVDAADPREPRLSGTRQGRPFSVEFTRMNLSAAPVGSGVEGGRVAGRFVLATVLRTNLPDSRRFLIARPFFRQSIHLPMRGLERVESPHPSLTDLHVLGEPGETFPWLDEELGAVFNGIEAWELRLEDGELSLMLDGNVFDPSRLDRALGCLMTTASRMEG